MRLGPPNHERRPDVHLAYVFDRLCTDKLQQVYALLGAGSVTQDHRTEHRRTGCGPQPFYARVSGDQQKNENTIASQTAALIAFAGDHGYGVAPDMVFEDDGYTGATLERPGLERVRDSAAEGRIDAVLVHAPDRLSRKYACQVLLMEEFARNGVETVFVKAPVMATAEDRLLVQFQGMIAEYERAQIPERSRRGKRHRARLGEVSVLSGAPYGYRYHKKTPESDAHHCGARQPASGAVTAGPCMFARPHPPPPNRRKSTGRWASRHRPGTSPRQSSEPVPAIRDGGPKWPPLRFVVPFDIFVCLKSTRYAPQC